LLTSTTALYNTAIGAVALSHNTTGNFNTAVGESALYGNVSGISNTAIGTSSMGVNTGGNFNTALGAGALADTISDGNTGIGTGALGQTTGTENIAAGHMAGSAVTTGSYNILIGTRGSSIDTNTIRIGGETALGDTFTQTSFFAAGIRGTTTANNDAIPVVIDSAGQLGTVNSSRRFKEDILDMGNSSSGLMRLRPVTFRYKQPYADGSKPIQYGLIAEEVSEVYPDLVAHSADGQIETVKYQVLDAMLLNEVQHQQRVIEQQRHEIETLKSQLNGVSALESRLVALENAVAGNR
jgi:hypothetical protein